MQSEGGANRKRTGDKGEKCDREKSSPGRGEDVNFGRRCDEGEREGERPTQLAGKRQAENPSNSPRGTQ